jgi:hypothetical protein
MRAFDLTGQQFNRLTVIAPVTVNGRRKWVCKCQCGNEVVALTSNLTHQRTMSCGCLNREVAAQTQYKHGMRHSREYDTFYNAKARCQKPSHVSYERYGGRGIEFRFESFQQFYAELGPRPSAQHSLDRVDTNGHYEPGNVRWATREEQAKNRRPRRTRKEILCS